MRGARFQKANRGNTPVAPGTLRPLRLHRDMQISGTHTLALTGPPGAFRVWASASTNGTPLLECGQTVSSTYYSTFVPDTENGARGEPRA